MGQEEEAEKNTDAKPVCPGIELEIYMREGISRNTSPVMVDLLFKNITSKPHKLCIYKFYDALVKLNLYNAEGKKIEFDPKLVQARKLTDDDWFEIPPKRVYKRTFSLTRRVVEATAQRLEPGNYSIKAVYEGCNKFDPELPEINIESNLLYFMVTD